jgi:hypothetical protein
MAASRPVAVDGLNGESGEWEVALTQPPYVVCYDWRVADEVTRQWLNTASLRRLLRFWNLATGDWELRLKAG